MTEHDWLTQRFAEHRGRLTALAYRMLGSRGDAEDAMQESWLRVSRADGGQVENPAGWLTTVVARVCLNMLESRRARREEPAGALPPEPAELHASLQPASQAGPEDEALLADSVGAALMVVLDTLTPAERLAFVLHDMFAVPFNEIAPIVGRSPEAARQLASRARRRIQGEPVTPDADLGRQREVFDAFLAAARGGDFNALVAVLDPDVVVRIDLGAAGLGMVREVRGAEAAARNALGFAAADMVVLPALINGVAGAVMIRNGKPVSLGAVTVRNGKVVAIDILADPARLRELDLSVLEH